MSNRTLLIVLGILIVILIPLLMKDWRITRPDEILFMLDSSKISQIEVVHGDNKSVIKRVQDEWRLVEPVDWPVTNFLINNLMNSLDTVEVEYEVTDDPTQYKKLGVDDSTGAKITITMKDGKQHTFIVGNLGGSWRHTHIKLPDKKTVYLTKGAIRSQIVKQPDEWRDRRLFNYSQDSLVILNAKVGKDVYSLVMKDSIWLVTPQNGKAFEPNPNRLTGILNGILKMSIADFPPDTLVQKLDWSRIASQFEFEMQNGKKHNLTFTTLPADTNKLYYRVDQVNGVFSVWKASYDMYAFPLKELQTIDKKRKN